MTFQPNSQLNRIRAHTPFLVAAVCLAICIPSSSSKAQVFRGYGSSGYLELNSERNDREETIRGYYPDGSLEFIIPQRKGRIDGTVREFYPNGMLRAEVRYKDGVRDGRAKFYYETGMLMCKIQYKDGEETGRSKFYDPSGEIRTSINEKKQRIRHRVKGERIRLDDEDEEDDEK